MNINLSNRYSIVLASSQGLGFSTALELSRCGSSVSLVSRNKDNLVNALKLLDRTQDQNHNYIVADFSDTQKAIKDIKNQSIRTPDILITNGGGPPAGSVLELSTNDYQNAFDSHFKIFHDISQWAISGMKEREFGRIINLLSVSVSRPIENLPVSNMIRAGISNWGKTLALSSAKYGITVNNILTGYTKTDRLQYLFSQKAEASGITEEDVSNSIIQTIPAKRMGRPEEVAYLACFLASKEAGYITGVDIPIDGGSTI